jgi:hypothetical protein
VRWHSNCLEHVLKERCAPLERWRILRVGSLPLERWRPSTFSLFTLVTFWSVGRGGSHLPQHLAPPLLSHVVRPSPPLGAPSSLGIFTLCYLYKHSLHCKLVGVGESCLWLYTIVILFIWNKETLEVKKVCYTCVWMLDVICA